jgi:hypothetical protein
VSWDRKKGGPETGYYYESVRTPDGVKKVYRGRGAVGQLAASLVEGRSRARRAARDTIRAEADAVAEANRLADELLDWARLLGSAWLVATGHHNHKGCWRQRRGR